MTQIRKQIQQINSLSRPFSNQLLAHQRLEILSQKEIFQNYANIFFCYFSLLNFKSFDMHLLGQIEKEKK